MTVASSPSLRALGLPALLLATTTLLGGFSARPAPGQEAPSRPPEGQPAADPELERTLREFQQRIQAGDTAAAIELMEDLTARPDAPPMARGILGGLYVDVGRTGEAYDLLRPLADDPGADPAVLYNAGRAALALGELESAESYLERATEQAPASPAARELGLLRGRQGRTEDAYIRLMPWVLENPSDLEARRAAALGAIQLRRLGEAERLLTGMPLDDAGTRLLTGRLRLLQQDPYGAIELLEPLINQSTGPLKRDTLRSLSEAYLQVGESSKAIAALENEVNGDPRLALRLSQALYQSGDLDRALAELEPYSTQVLENEEGRKQLPEWLVQGLTLEYGRLLAAASRPTEAIPYLELATAAGTDVPQTWQTLGQALAAIGDRDRAAEAMARFQELSAAEEQVGANQRERDLDDPSGRVLREAMGMLANDNAVGALSALQREIELNPGDPRLRVLEGRALLLLERPEDSLEAAQKALELAPDDADANYIVGTALMALERTEEAEARLRQTLELLPEHTAAMNDLAVLLMGKGETEEAAVLLQKVLQINPNDSIARANLDQVLDGH